jgi:sugar-specific transcriptional regulator TrmB
MLSIPEILERMGLNDKETAVYLALLSVGTAPSSALGKRTKLPKSTAHYTCQQLVKKGLARMVQKGTSFYFTCEPPEKLLQLLEKKRKDIDSLQEHVSGILGPLKNMISVFTSLPNIQYHEGESGIIELLDDILKLQSPIDSFEDRGYVFESFPGYEREFARKRVDLKIPSRCITPVGSTRLSFSSAAPAAFNSGYASIWYDSVDRIIQVGTVSSDLSGDIIIENLNYEF